MLAGVHVEQGIDSTHAAIASSGSRAPAPPPDAVAQKRPVTHKSEVFMRWVGLVAFAMGGTSVASAAVVRYTVQDVGAAVAGSASYGEGINAAGDVVGYGGHAFLWRAGVATDLGSLIGPSGGSYGYGVNDADQVIATSLQNVNYGGSVIGGYRAMLADGKTTPADLGSLGGRDSFGGGINDAGVVVGGSYVSYASNTARHAFTWQSQTGMRDLGTLGGTNSDATSINLLGRVVGRAQNAAGYNRATQWTGMTPTDLRVREKITCAIISSV